MKKLLQTLVPVALAAAAFGAGAQDLPGRQAHHHRRAVRGRRPHRPRGARPGRSHAQAAGRRHHRGGQRRRRRRLDRRQQGRQGHRRRPHAAAAPHRHGHHAHAGAQHPVQGRERLRVPGHGQRRADDADRQARRCRPTTTRNWPPGSSQNKGKINLGNAGVGSASHLCGLLFQSALKARHDAVPYKGTAPGHDRPDRRPDRPDVRPDHQHHRRRSRARRSRPTP